MANLPVWDAAVWSVGNWYSFGVWFQRIATTHEKNEVKHLFIVDHKPPLPKENDNGTSPWQSNHVTLPIMLKDGDDMIKMPSKLCDGRECSCCLSGKSKWSFKWRDARWTPQCCIGTHITRDEHNKMMNKELWPIGPRRHSDRIRCGQ